MMIQCFENTKCSTFANKLVISMIAVSISPLFTLCTWTSNCLLALVHHRQLLHNSLGVAAVLGLSFPGLWMNLGMTNSGEEKSEWLSTSFPKKLFCNVYHSLPFWYTKIWLKVLGVSIWWGRFSKGYFWFHIWISLIKVHQINVTSCGLHLHLYCCT